MAIKQKYRQHENVSKTINESKIFESQIGKKNENVKIHLEFVSFLAPQNRHVRGNTRIMQRAERCKIEEISLK